MQPRKFNHENFGPYIHEELDFGDFQEGGLFLVSGKTGAGKGRPIFRWNDICIIWRNFRKFAVR